MSFSDFSICLTVFNNESTIGRCLSSVTQFCPGAEVIVVESFSKDDTFSIISKFPDARCLRKRCKRGEGYQLAALLASRRFLAFIAGDWEVLQPIRGLLETYRRFYSDKALLLKRPPRTPLLLVSKQALSCVGGFRPLQYGEDEDLWVRLAGIGLLRCTDVNPFIRHRRDPKRSRIDLSTISRQLEYYYGLSLSGFGMNWRLTPLFPIRLLGYLAAYPRRDKRNKAAKRIGSMDGRIDLVKRLGMVHHCYLPPAELLSKISEGLPSI